MKKFNHLTLLILLFSLILGAAVFVTADTKSVMLGDVNGDGDITAADALEVLQYSVGKIDSFSGETSSELRSTSEPIPHFLTFTLKDFTDWINKGGDDVAANQVFLKTVKEQNKLLIAKAKKEELKEYIYEVFIDQPAYSFAWVIDEDNMENRQIFGIAVFMPNENIKCKSLEELYYQCIPGNIPEKVKLKYGERNGVNYLYTDYEEDENGKILSDSRALFFIDDYLVTFNQRWTLQSKPFNPEYLDYFDFETIDLNIQSDNSSVK